MPMPVLTTDRLTLRPPQNEDFDAWAASMADPAVAQYIGGVQPRPIAWRGFAAMVGAWQLTGISMFSVLRKDTGEWIGRIGPWRPEGWPGNEVGWALIRPAWGQGFALEAATACMDYAFDELGWQDVIHTIDPENEPSKQLARRLGSHHDGFASLPEPYADHTAECWRQSRTTWRSARR